MRLVKDSSPGGRAVRVVCIGTEHGAIDATRRYRRGPMFTLAEGYADLDGEPFKAYYCDDCAEAMFKERPEMRPEA